MIAFVFIMWHVFHMHGWIHAEWWVNAIRRLPEPFRGANFRPCSAASTAGEALQSVVVVGLYAIGILASVFHLANGIWTMGITWGVWTSPMAQRRASLVCSVFGVALAVVGMSALWGMHQVGEPENLEAAVQDEDKPTKHSPNQDSSNRMKKNDAVPTTDETTTTTSPGDSFSRSWNAATHAGSAGGIPGGRSPAGTGYIPHFEDLAL